MLIELGDCPPEKFADEFFGYFEPVLRAPRREGRILSKVACFAITSPRPKTRAGQ